MQPLAPSSTLSARGERSFRYAEAGANVETGAFGKSYDPAAGRFVYSCSAPVARFMAGEYTQSRPPREVDNPLPDCVDDTRTVLVRSYLRERRRCSVARTNRTSSRWG